MNTIRQFEIVLEIARCGSVSQAATVLKVSQPTLSKVLRAIEECIGINLFDHTVSPIKLTSAGHAYIEAAREIVDAQHCLLKKIDEIKTDSIPVLNVGISPSRAPYIMPELIGHYLELSRTDNKESNRKIVVRECSTRLLNSELLHGNLDLIINMTSDETSGFSKRSLFIERVLLACPSNIQSSDVIEILRNNNFISVGKGQMLWRVISYITREIGKIEPNIECQSVEAALSLVNKELGVTLVPSYYITSKSYENVKYLEFPAQWYAEYGGTLEREICVFFRSDKFLNSSEKRFIRACELTFMCN